MTSKNHSQRFDSGDTKAHRFDYSPITGKPRRTHQGFLVVPGALTRVGVLEYRRMDGTVVKELRPPEEVFKADSVASLSGAPVTVGHIGLINPGNADHSVGNVSSPRVAEPVIAGDLTIQRKDTIDKVERKDLVELSPGYTCRIDKTPGVFNGERYDQIQRDIVYNHVAMGPKGWGRSGPQVSIKMDGAEDVAVQRFDNEPAKDGHENQRGLRMKKIVIRIDGIAYEVEVAEGLAPTLEGGLDKMETERADAKAELSRVEGELAATQKELDETKVKLDSATSPEALEAMVKERSDLIAKAKELAPEMKFDGKEAREIKVEALEVTGVARETFDGKDEAFVDGFFLAAKPAAKPAATPSIGVGGKREDAKEDDKEKRRFDSATARREMEERSMEAWKQKI
jgi:hypothetical protein